jgi:RNA polymerase sigma factor (sigma-70 family)
MKSNALFSAFRSQTPKSMEKLEEILAGCLANDEKCKEWIYKSFYGYLMGIVIRYHKDPSQAEELVNDSFMKVFKNLNTFTYPNDIEDLTKLFKNWIAKIASRTVIDYLRIDKNHRHHEEITEFLLPAEALTVPDKMNVGDILKLLNELPQLQKIIFNMYEIEGYKHEEVAAVLDIPVKDSRVYLARAKKQLRLLYSKLIQG